MRKSLGALLIVISLVAVGGLAAKQLNASYWILSPKEKFISSWQSDINALESAHKLPSPWKHIRQIEFKSDNSPAADWLDSLKKQFQLDPNGSYKLNVMVIHWIEKNRYGAIVQYSITDLKSGNTIWELSRTLPLGFLI